MSAWLRREEYRETGPAHGIRFVHYERRGARAEVAIGARKVQIDGTGGLQIALGQYAYGDELIAHVVSASGRARVSERRSDKWTTQQIYLGAADADTAAMLEAVAAEIRGRL